MTNFGDKLALHDDRVMAALIMADMPDRSSSDKRGHSGSSGSKRKRRARRQGDDSIPIVALNLDEEETVIDRSGLGDNAEGTKMLVFESRDPTERITATKALAHPWLREDGEASDQPIDGDVLTKMKQFKAMNKLKKVALKVMAENLVEEEIIGLKEMFNNIDTDRSGTITL